MDDDTTKEYVMEQVKDFDRRKPVTKGDITIEPSKCELNKDQVINLIQSYRTRMWQFREYGGMYLHMAEAIKDYQRLQTNGIIFPALHRAKVRKD